MRLPAPNPRLALAGLVAMAALLGLAGAAVAQQAKGLRLVTPRGEKPDAVFPAFTRAVQARFDYLEAEQTPFAFLVYGPGGIRLQRKDLTLTGSGTATVDITGQALVGGLAAGLVANSQEMQRAAAQAAGASRGVREYLNGVQAALILVRSAQRLLAGATLPPEATSQEAALDKAAVDLEKLLARARLLDDSDDPGLRNVAAQMAGPTADAVAAATGLEAAMKGLDTGIPPTGTGSSEGQAYTLTVLVDGQPATSTFLWIKVPVYLPYAIQKR